MDKRFRVKPRYQTKCNNYKKKAGSGGNPAGFVKASEKRN
jgi:hypothetical protein